MAPLNSSPFARFSAPGIFCFPGRGPEKSHLSGTDDDWGQRPTALPHRPPCAPGVPSSSPSSKLQRRKSPSRRPPSDCKRRHLVEQRTLYTEVPLLLTVLEDFPLLQPRQVPFPRPTAAPGRSSEPLDAQLQRRRSLERKRLEGRKLQQKKALSLTFSETCHSGQYLFAVWRFPPASHRPSGVIEVSAGRTTRSTDFPNGKSPRLVRVFAQKH